MDKVITDFFPAAYCINLDDKTERMAAVSSEFGRFGLNVQRVSAVKGNPDKIPTDRLDGEVGCALSHRKCLMMAEGLDRVLIFEDDVRFRDGANELFADYFSRVPDDWDMIYLGGNHWGWNLGDKNSPKLTKVAENVYRTTNTLTTHAYAIRHTIFDEVIKGIDEMKDPVDILYTGIQKRHNAYVFRPSLAWQQSGISDINNKYMDYYFIREW